MSASGEKGPSVPLGTPPEQAATEENGLRETQSQSPTKAMRQKEAEEREMHRKRELMLKFRDSLRGPVLEKLYSEQIVGPSTSYDVEKWVRRIFHMDPLGALRQLRDLGAVTSGGAGGTLHVDVQRRREGERKRNTAKLKAAPFNAEEKVIIDKHIASRVKKLVSRVDDEFAVEGKYVRSLKTTPAEAALEKAAAESPDGRSHSPPPLPSSGAETGGRSPEKGIHKRVEVVELRLSNLKRHRLKELLQEEILLYISEGEQLVYDKRFEDEQERAAVADARWSAFVASLPSAKAKKSQSDQQDVDGASGGGVRRKVELKKNTVVDIPVRNKMSSVYRYIDARYQLEGSKSSLRRARSAAAVMRAKNSKRGQSGQREISPVRSP